MKNLWTDERNRLRRELVKAELCISHLEISVILCIREYGHHGVSVTNRPLVKI